MVSKTDQLRRIRDAVINLQGSALADARRQGGWLPVLGEGSHDAAVMFIGEAPGENEAKQGRPFCGASGRVLDELLSSIAVPRETVYVTNIVKDRPPKNRDPLPEEIAAYAPFLRKQIAIIQPKVIAPLGRFSMEWVMRNYGLEEKIQGISKIHGQAFVAKADWGEVTVIPFFHPAVALYTASQKATLLEDFKILKQYA